VVSATVTTTNHTSGVAVNVPPGSLGRCVNGEMSSVHWLNWNSEPICSSSRNTTSADQASEVSLGSSPNSAGDAGRHPHRRHLDHGRAQQPRQLAAEVALAEAERHPGDGADDREQEGAAQQCEGWMADRPTESCDGAGTPHADRPVSGMCDSARWMSWMPSTAPPTRTRNDMRITAARRTANENRIRAATDRLPRGEIPTGATPKSPASRTRSPR
jgi:hypothetical protein